MGIKTIIQKTLTYFGNRPKKELIRIIDVIRKKYQKLSVQNDELIKENKILKEKIEQLTKEKNKDKVLKVNRTSNKPSSQKADWELDGVGNDGKGKKKGRGKKGRKGAGNKPKNQKVSRVEKAKVENCYKCGKDLKKRPALKTKNTRIIVDIPSTPMPVEVIEIEQEKKYCDTCKEVITASTELAVQGMNIGINATTEIVYMWIYLCLSFTRIQTSLLDRFNLQISTSGLSKHVQKISKILEPVYEEILENVKGSYVAHADETRWKVNGIKWWLWVFGNSHSAYYTIDRSRGKDVVRRILGEVFLGILVVDGWKAYLSLLCEKQSCMAHLLRKIRNLHHAFPKLRSVLSFYIQFRKILRDGEKLQSRKGELESKIFKRRLAKLHSRLEKLLQWKNPNEILKDIIKKVKNQQPKILTFVDNPGVPCHNNFGEYLMRIGVLKRKISFGSKSSQGAEAYAILLSIYVTCKLRKINFLKFLKVSLIHYSQFKEPLLLSEYREQLNTSLIAA